MRTMRGPYTSLKTGRHWDSKDEIGSAATDPEGEKLILGECKYWSDPVGISVLWYPEAKTSAVAWEWDSWKIWYVLFSVSGFAEELKRIAADRKDMLLVNKL